MKKHYTCPHCNKKFIFNADEVLQHERECDKNTNNKKQNLPSTVNDNSNNNNNKKPNTIPPQEVTSTIAESNTPSGLNRTSYQCEKCDKIYLFTPIELLKHKRTHS